MKNIIFLLLVLLVSCKDIQKEKSEIKVITADNFDWLLGNWQRTNNEPNMLTYESWQKINELEYNGLGLTLQEKDTLFMERIKLRKTKNDWNLEVITKEDKQPTLFRLTTIEENGFTCKNPLNEFPKTIHYFRNGEKLGALISGNDMEISFEFEKRK